MAVPITEAFHVSMKIAPAPKNNEKNKQNNMTFILFRNIFTNTPELINKFPEIFEFIEEIVFNCVLNSELAVSDGRITNHSEYAIMKPKNRKTNAFNALLCCLNSDLSSFIFRSSFSSNFIVECISGIAIITVMKTETIEASSLKINNERIIEIDAKMKPYITIDTGFFSAFIGFVNDSKTIIRNKFYFFIILFILARFINEKVDIRCMSFVNTLPYISNPIEEFKNFKFVSWEKDIYPKFKGGIKESEIEFFVDIVNKYKLKNILDFGVGGGVEISGLIKGLRKKKYNFESIEANEVDEDFIKQAKKLFNQKNQEVIIHKSNWLDLPEANPKYTHLFDLGFLTGNSLTYIGGGTRDYTKKAQQSVVSKFARLIKKGGYLFIDSRDYDYIKSLMNLPKEKVFENFTFDYSVYYHGFQKEILVFPAYISDTVVVLHYYDKSKKIWSKLDLYPIYKKDMIEILSNDFKIEKIYYDFEEKEKKKSLFIQYLAKRK